MIEQILRYKHSFKLHNTNTYKQQNGVIKDWNSKAKTYLNNITHVAMIVQLIVWME